MQTILNTLIEKGELILRNEHGAELWRVYAYHDGTLTARRSKGGLMAPMFRHSKAGLMRLFDWMDANS